MVFAFRKIKQEKETETGVPSIVTTSIRHAAAKAGDAEKAAVAAQKDAEEKKALAESALAQKTKVEKEKEDAACATISAENAWNSAEEDRTAAQLIYTDAVEKRNTREAEVNEMIRKLKAEVAELIQEQEIMEVMLKRKHAWSRSCVLLTWPPPSLPKKRHKPSSIWTKPWKR